MRGPVAAGVLAGLLVLLVALVGFIGAALGRPVPTLPPFATPGLDPSFAAASPSASPTRRPTPLPTATAAPTASGSLEPVGLAVGQIAPTLTLPAVGGSEIDTGALDGQALWVNFMATWCPPCRDELPVMQRLGEQLEGRMTIVLVDVAEPEATVEDFLASLGVDLPTGLDRDAAAQRAWGAYALPVHYWIGPDGRVGGFLYGGAGPEQLIEGVRTVLPDAELEP